ncbi:MAG: hypothetical protein ABI824_14085 [Acidobacteriota bacterium]
MGLGLPMAQYLQSKMIGEIVGECLSSVTFVQDYIQFHFDGPCLTTLTLPSFYKADSLVLWGDAGYRDSLCSAIGIKVTAVRVTDDALSIEFSNSSIIAVSLKDEDYRGPEAINYQGMDGVLVAG